MSKIQIRLEKFQNAALTRARKRELYMKHQEDSPKARDVSPMLQIMIMPLTIP